MKDLSKYIGLIHKYQGCGKYCDCLNLVAMFYKDHGWQPDWNDHIPRPDTYDEYIKHQPTRIVRYLFKHFTKVRNIENLQYGDVILANVGGEVHLGVYLYDGNILTMEIPVIYGKSKSTIYKARYWKPFFKMGFRRQ